MGGSLQKLKIDSDDGFELGEITLRGTYENPFFDMLDLCNFLKISQEEREMASVGCKITEASEIYNFRKEYHNNMGKALKTDSGSASKCLGCNDVYKFVANLGDRVNPKLAAALTSAARNQIGVNLY